MCIAAIGGLPAILGTVATVGSTIFQMAGAAQASQAAQDRADFQAKQARIQAEDAVKRGVAEEQAQRRKSSALQSRQAAVLAASNLDLSSGSPLDILTDTAELGELDALTIRGNAGREAASYRAQADLYEMEGDAAAAALPLQLGATALGGATSLAERWYRPFSAARAA
jgi:hypothetical protein